MKVNITPYLSDRNLDGQARSSQRQLSLALSTLKTEQERDLIINLCLIIDISSSMAGEPLDSVKQAAIAIIRKLHPGDRISLIAFNHQATTIIQNQLVQNIGEIEQKILGLVADGGRAIDLGMKLGIKEVARGRRNSVSQIFLLTDGENADGSNERCLKLAQLASEYSITINTLGFGNNWNQDILETIADSTHGSLIYIEKPETVIDKFQMLLARLQYVGLTNCRISIELKPGVRLAEFKPIAQVSPETIELPTTLTGNIVELPLGDLMTSLEKVVLVNLYINQLPPGKHSIAIVKVAYDDPAFSKNNLQHMPIPIQVEVQTNYESKINQQVHRFILMLAKYRQTKIAETKLLNRDRKNAVTMLQNAANIALQLGDILGAKILQNSAEKVAKSIELSPAEQKKARLAAKTILKS